ncbi:hypothetical protein Tco_1226543, partial [Tanacetum coccineum]
MFFLWLVLFSFIEALSFLGSWEELVVRVGSNPSNPSLLFVLSSSQPLKGCFGLSVLSGWRVIGAMGRWEWVRVSWEWYLGGGLGLKPWGRGGLRFWRQVGSTVM